MKKKFEHGLTLVEVIVTVAILAVLCSGVYGVFTSIYKGISYYRNRVTVSALADQYLEIARNLPYSQVGTLNGNPHGSLPDLPEASQVSFNNVNYQIYYAVSYVDDPADGTILAGTDPAPNDYKQIKLYVKNAQTGESNSFMTNIVPKNLEGMENGGAFSIKVFNAVGQPVPGAIIHITNTSLIPNIDLTRTSDANGNWLEVGLASSANSYHIVVTKTGYSSDQTYAPSLQNPSPIKADATISNGEVTSISFAIDKLSNLSFQTLSSTCQPMEGVALDIRGSKLIGTPDIFKFTNTYTSNSSGKISIPNIEWDNYTPALAENSYMIYGSSPIQQVNILPGTTQNFNLKLGVKTDNSLLAIVKDSSTGNPVEGAQVDLQSSDMPNSFNITALTNSNGTITPSGEVSVSRRGNQTFNILPNAGYEIQNVSVDGVNVGAVTTYTFNNVSSEHAIYATFAPSASWLSGWTYRKKITISNANVNSDLTDFPALVKISNDTNISAALASGNDIRFTDSTGTTLLNFEKESWTGGNGSPVTANFWVKVPLISHADATIIYIYYGKSDAEDAQNANDVWNNNFKGVWHLNNPSNPVDSKGANSATNHGSTSVAGKVAGAGSFNGTNNYIGLGSNVGNFGLSNNFTISAWVNPALDSTNDIIYGNTWDDYGYRLGITSSKKAEFILSRSSNRYKGVDSSVLSSGWHHIIGIWNGSNAKIFIDGAENSATAVARNIVDSINSSENTKMGLDTTGDGHYFKGSIDEVRVSDSSRSADWIKFEYHNISDYGNNLTFSVQETKIDTYKITTSAGANGTITPSGEILANSGAVQKFIITPKRGYHISGITVDDNSVGTNNIYTFNNVSGNHTISASFEQTIINGGYAVTGYTSGSVLGQQDWSGGSGQELFTDTGKYYEDDGNVSIDIIPLALRLLKNGSNYVPSATLISSTFDTGTEETTYTTLMWQPTSQDPATAVKFQIATNNDNKTWNFSGPDGTENTYYVIPGTTINQTNNNKRYVRYKVFLSTEDSSKTPALTSVSINYVSGCFTPGQTMFAGLSSSSVYQATITMQGYQTQTISGLEVEGYQTLQVSLEH